MSSLRISLCKGRHREGALDCAERVRCPRAERHTPFPGGFGHHLAGTTTGPWVRHWTGTGGGGERPHQLRPMLPPEGGPLQIGVLATSQETWPEVARSGRKPARQNRGGTPTGERAASSTRPCQLHGRLEQASVGVPLPFLSVRERSEAIDL